MIFNFYSNLLLTIFVSPLFSMNLYAIGPNWAELSRELTSEDRSISISAEQALKKMPNLSDLLTKALKNNNERSSALLIIRKLKIEEVVKEVIDTGKAHPDGEVFLTLQTLSTGNAKSEILLFFRGLLESNIESQNPVAILVSLSTIQEANESIPLKYLSKLLEHENFEVRIGTINFAAQAWLNGDRSLDILFRRALQSHPFQLRESALIWLKQANKNIQKDFLSDLKFFDLEKNLAVKNLAYQILQDVSKE